MLYLQCTWEMASKESFTNALSHCLIRVPNWDMIPFRLPAREEGRVLPRSLELYWPAACPWALLSLLLSTAGGYEETDGLAPKQPQDQTNKQTKKAEQRKVNTAGCSVGVVSHAMKALEPK